MVVGLNQAASPLAIQAVAHVFHRPLLMSSLRELENYLSCYVKIQTNGSMKDNVALGEATGVSKVLNLFKSVLTSEGVEITGGSLMPRGEGNNWFLNVHVVCILDGVPSIRNITIGCTLVQFPYLEKRISEITMQFH